MTRSNDSLKVIVVGIPKTLDDAGLLDLFSAYGAVADAKVVKDAATDASRGFGFVTFTAQSAMRRAVKEMDKKQVEGRTLNVRQLIAKEQLQKRETPNAQTTENAARPCYLLRKGKCTKGDRCMFSHDIKGGDFGSCFEFVQNGACKRGDNCKFFHPTPVTEDGEDEAKGETERTLEPSVAKETVEKKDIKAVAEKKLKDEKKPKDDKPRYCFAYQSGRCHRGKRCLYLHEKLVVPENELPPAPAPVARKRPGDFEVVSSEAPSTKRRRESDDEEEEDDSDMEETGTTRPPVAKPIVKAKPVEKKTVEKKEKPVKAKPGTDEKPVIPNVSPAVGADGKPIHTGPKPICRHFLKGMCKRGHICFFRHEQPTEEELKELLPLIKGNAKVQLGKKGISVEEEEDEAATPLQAVADHMASFMATFDASKPFEPFLPSATPLAEERTIAGEETQLLKRKASVESEETSDDHQEQESPPPVAKRQRSLPKEKIDMGAAFDGADSDDTRRSKHRANKKRKPTKEEMKANREKLRLERRAKKTAKTLARDRLKTDGEIELS